MLLPDEGNGPYRVLRGFARDAVDTLERGCEEPERLQAERLRFILRGVTGTTFGQEHGLAPDMGAAAFRSAVPIRTYAELSPWLDRLAEGEQQVLTQERVVQLLKTSGTTGRPKLLPVTRSWERVVADAQALWRLGLVRDHEGATKGKALAVVSPAVEGHTAAGVPYGSNTGRMHARQPWIVRLRYPVPDEVFALEDPVARTYAVLRFALQAPVTTWTTANPSTVLLLCRKLVEHREALARDLGDGTLTGPASGVRLSWWARRALQRTDPPDDWRPASFWPLVSVNCWKAGPAPFFVKRLPEALGAEVPVRDVGLTASEGYFAIPLDEGDGRAVAWLGGHVMEFVGRSGEVLWAWQLEEGAIYRLVITTSAGLYRYDLGDLVEVVGFAGRAPLLRFLRRGNNVLSITGEKLTEDQLVIAVGQALAGAEATGFTAAHRLAEVPALRIGMEGRPPPDFLAVLEQALCATNIEYREKRASGRLAAPELVLFEPGTYERWRAARVAEGAPEGQVKDPLLALDEAAWAQLVSASRATG